MARRLPGQSERVVLLVDIGNTRVKWAVLRSGRIGVQHAAAHNGWSSQDFARHIFGGIGAVSGVRVASVAGTRVNRRFSQAARARSGIRPRFVRVTGREAGVSNGYRAPWRLGVDRWVAAIAGHHFFNPPRAVCVVDIGTAMTIDLVDARGRHRGGVIVPGPQLMIESLLAATSGIRARARAPSRRRTTFARDTRAALESGARHAAAAAIDRFALEAGSVLRRRPVLLLTGGAVRHVAPWVKTPHRVVPDLVLRGLAVLR